jgi:hypothetical protein
MNLSCILQQQINPCLGKKYRINFSNSWHLDLSTGILIFYAWSEWKGYANGRSLELQYLPKQTEEMQEKCQNSWRFSWLKWSTFLIEPYLFTFWPIPNQSISQMDLTTRIVKKYQTQQDYWRNLPLDLILIQINLIHIPSS